MAAGINRNKYQMDMCHGPLMKQIVTFAVPFVFSGLLQIFFHAADLMVVGRFSSHRALAAVGATGSLTMLIINILVNIIQIGNFKHKSPDNTLNNNQIEQLCD